MHFWIHSIIWINDNQIWSHFRSIKNDMDLINNIKIRLTLKKMLEYCLQHALKIYHNT